MKVNGEAVLNAKLIDVYRMWEETSYQLECLQANSECVRQEWEGMNRTRLFLSPIYRWCFEVYLVI